MKMKDARDRSFLFKGIPMRSNVSRMFFGWNPCASNKKFGTIALILAMKIGNFWLPRVIDNYIYLVEEET